jgi:hypothetical protein
MHVANVELVTRELRLPSRFETPPKNDLPGRLVVVVQHRNHCPEGAISPLAGAIFETADPFPRGGVGQLHIAVRAGQV